MPLTDEQMAARKKTNARNFRIMSIIFLVAALFVLVTTGGHLIGWAFLLVGLFMGLAWVPGMVKT